MRYALLPLLALAACSSDPVPADVPQIDVGLELDVQPMDIGEDRPTVDVGACALDVPCPCGGGTIGICQADTRTCFCEDVSDAGALDAGADVPDVAVADVQLADTLDVPAADAGEDAVAVADAADVQPVDAAMDVGAEDAVAVGDAGVDAGDVVDAPVVDVVDAGTDVPRDTGPVDGGPVVYDLEAARAETSYRVVYRQVGAGGDVTDCDTPAISPSCSVMGGTLRFSLTTCFGGTLFTGTFPLSTVTGRSLSMFSGGGGSFAPTLRFEAGRRIAGSPARRSFHVQAAAPVQNGEPAVSGIPGRTVDPTLGDLWLLGCVSD
jgi:hypothetical protein